MDPSASPTASFADGNAAVPTGSIGAYPAPSASAVNLRALIESKQHELSVMSAFHASSVAEENAALQASLAALQQRHSQLKSDFEYNLDLVAQRDAELARYDELSVSYARTLDQKQSEFVGQLRAVEAKLDAKTMQLADLTEAHTKMRQTVAHLQEQLSTAKWSHESELRAAQHNAATALKAVEAKLAAKDEMMSKNQYELMHNFERATEQSAFESQQRIDQSQAQIHQLIAAAELHAKELQRAAERLATEQHRRTVLEGRLDETNEKVLALESTESELRAALAERESSHQSEVADLNASHESLVKKCVADYKSLASTLDKVQLQCESQTDAHRIEIDKMRRESERLQAELHENYQKQLHAVRDELHLTQHQLRDAQTLSSTLQQELDSYVTAEQSRTAALNGDLAQFQSQHAKQVQELNLAIWKSEEERKSISEKHDTLKQSLDARRQEIAALKATLTGTERRCEEIERQSTEQRLAADRAEAEAEETVANLRTQLQSATDNYKRMQSERDAQSSQSSHSQDLIAEYQQQLQALRLELLQMHQQENSELEHRITNDYPAIQQQVQQMAGELADLGANITTSRPQSRSRQTSSRKSQGQLSARNAPAAGDMAAGNPSNAAGSASAAAMPPPHTAVPAFVKALSLHVHSDHHHPAEVELPSPSRRPSLAARKQSITMPNLVNLNAGKASLELVIPATTSEQGHNGESDSDDDFIERPLTDSSADNSGAFMNMHMLRVQPSVGNVTPPDQPQPDDTIRTDAGHAVSSPRRPTHSPRPYTPAFSEDMGPVSLPNSMPNSPMGMRPPSATNAHQYQQQQQQQQQPHQQQQSHQPQRQHTYQDEFHQSHLSPPAPHRHTASARQHHIDQIPSFAIPLQHQSDHSSSSHPYAGSESQRSTQSTTSHTSSHVALERSAQQLANENAILQQQNASLSGIIREMKSELEQLLAEQQQQQQQQQLRQQQQQQQQAALQQQYPPPPFYMHPFYGGPPYPSGYPAPMGYDSYASAAGSSAHGYPVAPLATGSRGDFDDDAGAIFPHHERHSSAPQVHSPPQSSRADDSVATDLSSPPHPIRFRSRSASVSPSRGAGAARKKAAIDSDSGDDSSIDLSLSGSTVRAHTAGVTSLRDVPFRASDRATLSQNASARSLRARADLLRKKDADVKARADAARARVREQMKRLRAVEADRGREARPTDEAAAAAAAATNADSRHSEEENNPWADNRQTTQRITITSTMHTAKRERERATAPPTRARERSHERR